MLLTVILKNWSNPMWNGLSAFPAPFPTTRLYAWSMLAQIQNLQEVLKYSIIVISTAPLMFFYPFVQKYFVKGVMIGSLKG